MKLTEDHHPHPVQSKVDDWKSIEKSLMEIDANKKAFVVLTNSDGSYVQCAGGKDRLTAEIREINEDSFKHFIIGKGESRSALKTIWTQIDCRIGQIRVHDSEVLNMEDCIMIFKSFYNSDVLPDIFRKRNVTRNFKNL